MSVTFLFTDVEQSTRLWERAEGAMRRAMTRHDKILRKIVGRHGGDVFKTAGDAFFCAFERPLAAVRAAVEIQEALRMEPWPKPLGELRVRMGVHSGGAVLRRGDYVGAPVNRVTRLTAAARGGQILVSAATAALAAKDLTGIRLRDLGTHRLPETDEPEVLFEVVAPGLQDESAPVPFSETPTNLPGQTSTFVGRFDEIKKLRDLTTLYPLVTIVGLGGIGKTRLALHVATKLLRTYKDGCWFVPLKELEDPSLIAQVAADGMRLSAVGGENIEKTVFESLFKRQTLIVIDNAEHLLYEVANFARRLLKAAPGIRIVVTCREPLHVGGEQVLRLGSIDEGEQLFLDRARALRSDIALTDSTIAAICARLQGIPLAIELAAARIAELSTTQLDELLSIAGHPLDATIDWSYGLLGANEQRFFRRLAIFEGSFSSDAAQSVAYDQRFSSDGLTLLASLVDKSLVFQTNQEGGARYGLLEAVRAFAAQRLRESGEWDDVRYQHCGYYTRLVLSTSLATGKEAEGVATVTREWTNVRSALAAALEERIDLESGRWAVKSLWEFWKTTGRTAEGWYWVNRALEGTDHDPMLRAELLQRAAQIASLRHDYRTLDPLAKLLVEIHERSGDADGLAYALQLLTNAKIGLGNVEEGETLQMRALEQFKASGDRHGAATALGNLGVLQMNVHLNYQSARQLMTHSIAIFKELGAVANCAVMLGNLSNAYMLSGDADSALSYAEQSLMLFQRLGNEAQAGNQYLNIAEIQLLRGSSGEAVGSLHAARTALGDKPDFFFLTNYVETAFKLAVSLGRFDVAARLYGHSARQRSLAHLPLQRGEKIAMDSWLAKLTNEVGTLALDRLAQDGATMEASAIEGLIATLGPAPKQPSVSA